MREGVAEHIPAALDQAVDQDDARPCRDDIVVGDVQPPRSRHPVEPPIKQRQPHQPQPEDRHRIAEQPDDAHHLIWPAALEGARRDARRHTDQHTDQRGDRRKFEGGRKVLHQVAQHRM